MNSYAYYKLPYDDHYTVVEGDAARLTGLSELGTTAGFAVAPFSPDDQKPLVLIRTGSVRRLRITERQQEASHEAPAATAPTSDYERIFKSFHDVVSEGWVKKLVLSRHEDMDCTAEPTALFLRACQMYPRLMCMLFSTPQTGTWLVASPEILVEGRGDAYHTVALAGTMPWQDGYAQWNTKNQEEQQVVANYMQESLALLAREILADGPVTMRAGDLAHLRTDFRFHLREGITIGSLVRQLHPTPAVCGFPKEMAQRFIAENECVDRRYYSGFAGPVGIHGETHLYVSLRCAELHEGHATLYAGGGIMPGSQCLSEWIETTYKMKTIRDVLQ